MAEKKTPTKASSKASSDVTSDDRLWAALAYVFAPLIPVVILLMEDKKDRPFIKAHNAQALAWSIVLAILGTLGTAVIVGVCIWPIGYLVTLYFAYKAFQGEMVNIPIISDFIKSQGWA